MICAVENFRIVLTSDIAVSRDANLFFHVFHFSLQLLGLLFLLFWAIFYKKLEPSADRESYLPIFATSTQYNSFDCSVLWMVVSRTLIRA